MHISQQSILHWTTANSFLARVWMTPYHLVLKLSWTMRSQPGPTSLLGGEKVQWCDYPANRAGGIRLGAFRCQRVRDRGIEVIFFWCILPVQTGPGMTIQAFLTWKSPGLSQSLLHIGCINDFSTKLFKQWWQHQPWCQRPVFIISAFIFVFNSFDDSRLIDRVLSTNGFTSCWLFAALASAAIKSRTSILVRSLWDSGCTYQLCQLNGLSEPVVLRICQTENTVASSDNSFSAKLSNLHRTKTISAFAFDSDHTSHTASM